MGRKRRVGILVFDGVKLLDAAADTGPLNLALVAGGDVFPAHPVTPELAGAAQALAGRAQRIASICTGTFVLAAACWTAAGRPRTGGTRKSSPALTRRSRWRRRDLRGGRARVLLGRRPRRHRPHPRAGRTRLRRRTRPRRRPLAGGIPAASGGQSQFSPSLRTALQRTSPLRKLCDTVAADPAGDYSLATLAAMANVSPRHLTRLFRDELKTTPARYVELIRFDTARDLLDAGHSVTDTALRSDFGSAETLRRTFIQRLGVSPRAYQQRFRSAIRS